MVEPTSSSNNAEITDYSEIIENANIQSTDDNAIYDKINEELMLRTHKSVRIGKGLKGKAIVYTDKQGRIQQRSLPPQKLTILGKQQQPLIAKGHFDRGGDYAKTDLLISSLSGLGKVGEVFTQPNSSSSVVTGNFGSSVSTTVNNNNREVWAAVLDGFFNPLAERISDRSLRQEVELEKLPNYVLSSLTVEPNTLILGAW